MKALGKTGKKPQNRSMRILFLLMGCLYLLGCASLYHVQVGDIDNRSKNALVPFDLKVSDTGVDLQQAARIQRDLFSNSKAANDAGDIAEIVSLFQMGPRTGYPVYSDKYADKLIYAIHQQCPSGRITGITAIREARKYPVISGEIVKIEGYCMRSRKPASENNSLDDVGLESEDLQ